MSPALRARRARLVGFGALGQQIARPKGAGFACLQQVEERSLSEFLEHPRRPDAVVNHLKYIKYTYLN